MSTEPVAADPKVAAPTEDLSLLLCGDPPASPLGEVLVYLRESIDRTLDALRSLRERSENDVITFAPFLSRSLLELAGTALCGRIHPMRLLAIRDVQQKGYDLSRRWKIALQWSGDVLPADESKVRELKIEDETSFGSLSMAVLGPTCDELLWRPAVQALVDLDDRSTRWLADLLSEEPPVVKFVDRRRGILRGAYSTFSKGVHQERILASAAHLDASTIKSQLARSVQVLAELGLASQFIGHSPGLISLDRAVASFKSVETMEILP